MDVTRRTFALAGFTALSSAALSGRAWADDPAAVRQIVVEPSGVNARVSVGLDRHTQVRTFFLTEPNRFVIDIANSRLALPQGPSGSGAGGGVIRGYRYAPRPDGASRLVLDLEAPASLVRQDLGGRRQPMVSFDLAPNAPFVAAPAPLQRQGRDARQRMIVIDAGHGGRDPGAIGVTGVREKDVVLDSALKLRRALEHRGHRVAMTRDADTYVEHSQRVRFARQQNADLFISVHADSHANREAAGASVYTLSERGADRAQGMMDAQNWNVDLGDAPRQGLAHDILLDLRQRETINNSALFAQTVIPRIASVAPLLRNTHRNAGFFVLLAPDVPAVLIETGFLSNVADERRLADPNARERLADAMARAVDDYFAAPALYASA